METQNNDSVYIDIIKDLLSKPNMFNLSFEDIEVNQNIRNLAILLTIIYCICKYYNVDYKDLIDESKDQPLPFARQIYCYLSKTIYFKDYTLEKIGKYISRDHATVLYSCKKVEEYKETKHEVWYDLLNVIADIKLTLKEYNL